MVNPFGMLSKDEKQKIVGISIAAVIFLFILIWIVTIPSVRRWGELNKQIYEIRQKLKKSESLISDAPHMRERLVLMEQKLEEYKSVLPLYSDIPDILQNISIVATDSKVKLLKIQPLRTEKKPAEAAKAGKNIPSEKKPDNAGQLLYEEIPIQIEAKGGYHAIGSFINKIEMAKNIMSVADIKIEADANDIFTHNARLLIVAYVLRFGDGQ